ncbi:MAG: alpha-ketoglutarate-dependent dioxygenase AlkB, partial [Oceanicaulis sp.]
MVEPMCSPPGARLIRDFVSEQAAERLLAAIDASTWRADLKRRVQHYGWRYDYRERRVTEEMRLGPLPDWLLPAAEAVGDTPEFDRRPDQVIVNEYLP